MHVLQWPSQILDSNYGRLKASLPFNELAPSQTSIYKQPSAARGFNEPSSYSTTVSCLGHLISDGHQLSYHFHWEDQQSFSIPVNTSQSPVWLLTAPGSLAKLSQTKQQRLRYAVTDSQTQLKCQLVMKQHKILPNNVQINRKEDESVDVSPKQYHKWLDLSLLADVSKTSQII